MILTAAAVIAAVGTYAGCRSADNYDTTSADLSQPAEAAQPPSMTAASSDNNTEYGIYEDAEEDIADDAADLDEDNDENTSEEYDSADADNAYPDFYSAEVGAGDPIIEEAIVGETPPVTAEAKVSTALSDHLKSHPDAKFKGDAEISKYYLADSGEKRPDDMPSEFAQLDEMPDDVINAAAEAESAGEPIDYADPSEYAASKELYTQIGWNGYALTINIYNDESYYSYTILGNTITNNLLRQTYKLTPELSDTFEAFAKEQLGIQLYE